MKHAQSDTRELANAIRFLAIDAVNKAKSGHPGAPMGMADIAEVLWRHHLKHNPGNPLWTDRDRFVLSNGHGSMLLYSLLYLTGYKSISLKSIKNFRQLNSICAGHPEYHPNTGIETTTGPLGQGIANAVGFAVAERYLSELLGEDIIDHFTYGIVSDVDLMEGISFEAAELAAVWKLGKLIYVFDNNNISIDGRVSKVSITDQKKKFEAIGWHC